MIKYYFSKLFRKIAGMPSINNSNIHKTAKVGAYSSMTDSSMGKYSYIGDNTLVSCTNIGSFTSISSNCAIGGGAHPMEWVSTSPVFTSHRSILRFNFAKHKYEPYKRTEIGNDVWVGAHCLIKSGVKISDGAVVGMGSVVTKDIGPYEIWAGNPAHLIRKRFSDDVISDLLKSEWWNWDDNKIQKYADLFNDTSKFINEIRKGEEK